MKIKEMNKEFEELFNYPPISFDFSRAIKLIHLGATNANHQDSAGYSLFHRAYFQERFDVLYEKSVDINLVDGQGFTVLHHAISAYQIRAIEPIMTHDIDLSIKDPLGRNSLERAEYYQFGTAVNAIKEQIAQKELDASNDREGSLSETFGFTR